MGQKFAASPAGNEKITDSIFSKSPSHVYLIKKNLTEVPKQVLINSTVEKLFLSNNEISTLPEKLQYTKLAKLTEISLSKNTIISIPEAFCDLPALATLNLDYNNISTLPKGFSKLKSLEELDLDHNKFKGIELNDLDNLNKLNISYNHLEYIECKTEGLESLDACANNLKYIDIGPNILYLHLKFNEFEEWDYEFEYLNYLNLSLNFLKEINSPRVEELYLNYNQIRNIKIPKTIKNFDIKCNKLEHIEFEEKSEIQNMNLSFNFLKSFKHNIKNVKNLNLSYNLLEEFQIPHESIIKNLNLSNNYLTSFEHNFSKITNLNLSNNNIKTIEKSLFLCPLLTDLNLTLNQIEEIPSLKDSRSSIKNLHFSFNKVSKIDESFFEALPYLVLFDMSYNSISELPETIFNLTDLKSLYLNGNLFKEDSKYPKLKNTSDAIYIPKGSIYRSSYSGVSEMIGKRNTLEDAHILKDFYDDYSHIYALFDGHNGSEAARLCSKILINVFDEKKDIENPNNLLKDTFDTLEEEIYYNIKNAQQGTTATIIYIKKDKIYCGNVGDSKAILVHKDSVTQISYEHKPHDRKEFNMVKKKGGYIKDDRVQEVLSMTRSLGDIELKDFISSEPSLFDITIKEDDRYIVLACDGVWDVVSQDLIPKFLNPEVDCDTNARIIRDLAFSLGSTDNITCIVIDVQKIYKNYKENCKE